MDCNKLAKLFAHSSAKLALYHHEALVLAMKPTTSGGRWNIMCRSKRQVEEAASAITDILKELIQLKLTRYLPISVYVSLMHIKNNGIFAKMTPLEWRMPHFH